MIIINIITIIINTFIFIGIVSIVFSLRVDRLYDTKITWTDKYKDPESQEYQQLEHEAVRAVSAPWSYFFRSIRPKNVKNLRLKKKKNALTAKNV